jgi:hypothetical protein
MTSRIEMFLSAREEAARHGDRNLVRSLNADLARLGYVDNVVGARETAVAPVLETPETPAVPPKNKGGRKRLPRCEHGKIEGRCRQCATAESGS